MAERMAVIYNPSARGGKALGKKKKVESCLASRNVQYDLYVTESESNLIEIAARACRDYQIIIGVGGDTTINMIANQVIRQKTGNILGIISQGSTNDLARGIGVNKLDTACDAIASCSYRALDVGVITSSQKIEPYYFLAQASLGLGVEVNRYVSQWMKRHTFVKRFHVLAQATSGLAGIYNSFKTKAVPMNLLLESSIVTREIDSSLLIFNNTSYFAGRFKPSPLASPMDGKLDCCIFNSVTFVNLVRTALQIKSMKHLLDDKVEILQGDFFKIHSPQPFEFQIDGEIGHLDSELEVSVLPAAIRVIVSPYILRHK